MPRAVLVMLFVVASVGCKRKQEPAHTEEHDPRVAPMTAALEAPEGKNPCESAYNAFVALEGAALKAGMPTPWEKLPKRETFEETCLRLKPDEQFCLVPKNQADHKKCDPLLAGLSSDPWGKQIQQMLKPPPGVGVAPSAAPKP